MLPFSKRPPPPEEYFLRSGDFEAVNGGQQQNPNYAIPSAPSAARAPVFARQAAHTPYGFSQSQNQQYGQYADLSAPPPPHSLAPVAMYASSTHSGTNPNLNRSQAGTVLIREKPSLKWGVMIALTGALLGGVLGLGMDARRQSARAAAAAEARDAAPPAMVAIALPQAAAPLAAPRPVLAAVPVPVAVAPAPVANINTAPAVLPTAPAIIVPKQPEPAVARTAKPAGRRPTVSLAAKVNQPKAAPEPKAAAEPKAAPVAEKAAEASKPKKDASTKAAQDLLEQANKDTTNTL